MPLSEEFNMRQGLVQCIDPPLEERDPVLLVSKPQVGQTLGGSSDLGSQVGFNLTGPEVRFR